MTSITTEANAAEAKLNGGEPPRPDLDEASKSTRAAKLSGDSPFDDIDKLRAKNTAAFAGETETSTSIRLGKPPKNLYFRCPTDEAMYLLAQVWVSDDDNWRTYFVDVGLMDLEDLQGGLRAVILCPWMGADGALGLWAVSVSDTSDWAESVRHAISEAKKGWIRIQSDKKENRYRIFYPRNPVQSRPWPDLTLKDFCKSAFGSKVVTSEDDPLIRQLRNLGHERSPGLAGGYHWDRL